MLIAITKQHITCLSGLLLFWTGSVTPKFIITINLNNNSEYKIEIVIALLITGASGLKNQQTKLAIKTTNTRFKIKFIYNF